MAKNDKSVKRGVYLYIDGKQIKNDVNSIKAEIKKLTGELKDMTIGSREYVEQMAKIRNLNSMLKEHQKSLRGVNKEVKATTFSFGKFVDGFNRFGGFIASVVASLTGLVLGLKALRDEKNKLEDSKASLKALTGLDEGSVEWLTKQARSLATTMTKEGLRVRASTDEILDAYMLVGSAKPELLGNKEALAAVTEEAMRLQAAAGDIKLAEAVDAVTLSLNQFGAPAEEAGRYVNVLAAGSKEGAANIASINAAIEKSGVAASGANVQIEETVALIETLAYKGIKDEVAGTALKKFFLVLQTGADETNPKVVGLSKALENLKKKNMDAGAIKKMFGEEGYNAAAVILDNIDMVNRLTDAVTGSNVAFEQSAINSDTASAKLAQVRNQMKLAGIELIEKLNPAILVSTNAMTYVIKILPGVIDWFKKWGLEVMILSGYFLLMATRVTITKKAVAAYHAVLNAGIAIKKGYTLAIVALNSARSANLRGLVNMRSAMRTANILTRTATSLVTLLRSALFLMTGQLKAAGIAFKAFTIAARANPFGVILTALAGVATAISLFASKTNAVSEALSNFRKANSEAKGELTLLYNSLISTNSGTQKRLDLIKEFNDKYGSYLTNLLSEKSTIEDITTAYNEAALAIQRKIAKQTLSSQTEDIQTKALEKQSKILLGVSDVLSTKLTGSDVAKRMQQIMAFTERQVAAGKSASAIATKVTEELGSTNLFKAGDLFDIKAAMLDYAKEVVSTAQKVQSVKDKLNPWLAPDEKVNPINELPEIVVTPNRSTGKTESEEERKKRVKKELENIETAHNAELTHIQKLYLEGAFESEEEYASAKIDLEKKYLNQKLDVVGLEASEREKIQVKILEGQIKFNELCKKEDERIAKERKSIRDKQLQIELEQAAQHHYRNFTSEEEYQAEVKQIYEKYYNDLLTNFRLTEEQKTQVMAEQNKLQAEEDKKKYEKLREQSERYRDITMDIASEFGEAIGEMIANGELSMKNFLKETILMALDALERIIEISCLEITAKNLAASTPFNWIGAAKAAAEVAAIKASFALVKGLVGNFYTGGYTPSGDWDKPQGIVHSNEFVANRYAVANPAVRPVLDLIDSAQRSGTIANLTGGDIAAVAGGSAHPVAAASPVMQLQAQSDDRELKQTVRGLSQVLSRLVERLDEPIEAVGVISGRRGWKQKLDEYDRLLNNKSRKP